MSLPDFVFLLIPIALGVLAFRLSSNMDWHWVVGVLLALIPLEPVIDLS